MTMRILFATGLSYLPDRIGGAGQSTHDLSVELAATGATTAVLCARDPQDAQDNGIVRDDYGGYPVYRAPVPHAAVSSVIKEFQPDVAVVAVGLIHPIVGVLLPQEIPTVVYFRDLEFRDWGGLFAPDPRVLYLANSRFVAERIMTMFGLDCRYIPSVIDVDRYVTETSRKRTLFIGFHPYKGIEIAFRLAEHRPGIPFSFVESWPLNDAWRKHYWARANQAGNIECSRPVQDIRRFYAEARVLLAPSVWEEASGRVVTEAQVSGIPVLASNRGGLPEAVGPGGRVIDLGAPLDDWLAALDLMWEDEEEYARLSERARLRARRPEIAPANVAAVFLEHVTNFLAARGNSGR